MKRSDMYISWGSNEAYTAVHWIRFAPRVKKRGGKIIVINTIRIPLANQADMFIQLKPSSDPAFCLAVCKFLIEEDLYDHEFVEKYRIARAWDKYADSSLKSALRRADKAMQKSGEICLDAGMLYPGQDPDYSKTPQFSATGNRVKVVVTQRGHRDTVYVVTNCTGGTCKISDVITGGLSLKQQSNSCR